MSKEGGAAQGCELHAASFSEKHLMVMYPAKESPTYLNRLCKLRQE